MCEEHASQRKITHYTVTALENDQAHRPRTPGLPSEPGVTD
jgi:hypothetical protein